MPLGMAPQVIEPAATASPSWVQHLDNAMATVWSYHPVSVPAAAVWIQVGLGVWLLAASKGTWSRLGGVATVAWGLVVWMFGEAFGQILAPGQSWLFGLPGAVLLYCAAGALIALPETAWKAPRLGRWMLGALGTFWVGMALLQAWPGRGFWQGQPTRHSTPGTLTSMVQQMAATSQPHLLSSWVNAFGQFDAAHGWGRQPVCRRRSGCYRGAVHHRAPQPRLAGSRGRYCALPGRLGPDRGPRFHGRGRDRPQQHAPLCGAHLGRLPRSDQGAGPGRSAGGGGDAVRANGVSR